MLRQKTLVYLFVCKVHGETKYRTLPDDLGLQPRRAGKCTRCSGHRAHLEEVT